MPRICQWWWSDAGTTQSAPSSTASQFPCSRGIVSCTSMPQHDPWRPIIHTLGVRALLCRPDGTPDPCPEAALEAVQAAEALAATQPPASRQWAPGMPCSLPRGYAFGGLPAVVLAVEQDEARICIMFLGQLREITVDAKCLVARDE